MLKPVRPPDETKRLAALDALKILDTAPEERFDRITRVAAHLFDVPIALVSLVDKNRQWFKACYGLDASETSRDISFCGHAILSDKTLVIPDAWQDERFFDNPLVTDAPHIRFYAGQPLILPGGSKIGTLCLIDRQPRQWNNEDSKLLQDLAATVENELNLVTLAEFQREASKRKQVEEERDYFFTLSLDMLCIATFDGYFKQLNPAWANTLGFELETLKSKPFIEFVHPDDRDKTATEAQRLATGESTVAFENRYLCKDGSYKWLLWTATVSVEKQLYYTVARDITAQKETEKQLTRLAQYDSLTGLANRTLFMDRLPRAIARADRANKVVALMFLDLDHFKTINDTLGHDVGDLLLKSVADRLRATVRKTDTVARLAGDEFTVILEGTSESQEVVEIAQQILDAMTPPFSLANHEVSVTTSIGITRYPTDGDTVEYLMKNADTAMYHAKKDGRNTYFLYTADMNALRTERLTLEGHLRRAIEREEFLLHYQPQMSLHTGEITGVEALVRWQHPDQGLISPAKFLPLAEETGLIVPIGEWVLRTACNRNRAWRESGLPPVRVAVNLSARQFRDKRLLEMVRQILEDTGLEAEILELEITESSAMGDVDYTIATLQTLKTLGVQLSIDDFGTGYSSLSYLQRFPIDMLKIDQSFVHEGSVDSDDAAITRAIVALAHSLGLKVIAEGVETEDQLAFLRSLACDEIQGFLSSPPVPADKVEMLLQSGEHTTKIPLGESELTVHAGLPVSPP